MEVDSETAPEETKVDKEKKGIMVILVGAPGSGKSTFCEDVMRISARPWLRVCQDTIGNGKAGTKVQCVTTAVSALKDGNSVFIDRCNLEKEQRANFVKLGGSYGDVHAVVLDLPAKICISRCAKRTGHEGNLQGGKAAMVVNRMLQKKELPKLSEGFSRITFCQNESDVVAAVNTYGALGPSDTLPSGCFGQKNPDAKVQLGIMKFLKKVEPSSAANVSQKSGDRQPRQETNLATDKPDSGPASSDNVAKEVKDGEDLDMASLEGTVTLDDIPTLAFPSISTADFEFNLDKASDIIVEQVEDFVKRDRDTRLVLVDLSEKSKILSLVSTKMSQKNIDSSKFRTFVGDITRLYSQGGLRCNVIANAANWRLKPGGGGVNAAIYKAAGQALDTATKKRAGSLMPGKALVVPLPSTSPLHSREGVTHVIHVLGPNMNPMRPNCLKNDYSNGCKVLREAYCSLFEGFASIVRKQEASTRGSGEKLGSDAKEHFESSPLDRLPVTDHKVRRDGDGKSERNKKCKASENEFESSSTNFLDRNEDQSNVKSGENISKTWGPWAQALFDIAMHPEKHKNDVMEISDDVVVLSDQYPKAQKHLLVLARAPGLDQLADVRTEHLQLLRTMHNMGLKWAERFLTENQSLVFRLGYHSVPSMRQLHLHVISQDFDSECLKNKKHWHSFNSPFFRDSVDVMEEVSKHGKATVNDDKSYLSMELRCHRCRSAHPNIPRLKYHVRNCQLPFPATLLQNGRLVLPPSRVGTE